MLLSKIGTYGINSKLNETSYETKNLSLTFDEILENLVEETLSMRYEIFKAVSEVKRLFPEGFLYCVIELTKISDDFISLIALKNKAKIHNS